MMNKKILILALISLIVLFGCDNIKDYSIGSEQKCQVICLNEGLSLRQVTGVGDTTFCHCERIINIPNT